MNEIKIRCLNCFSNMKRGKINNKMVCKKCNSVFNREECIFKRCIICDQIKPILEFDNYHSKRCKDCEKPKR